MIKIIRGVFGYVDKDGAVIPKTVKDEPFEVSAEIEDRLISQGVAIHVGDEEAPAEEKAPETTTEETAEEEVKAEAEAEAEAETATQAKKSTGKKTNSKKKTSAKKDDDTEEPPAIEAVDPE